MTEIVIDCEVFARLSYVIEDADDKDRANPWVNSFRIENNVLVATSRRCLIVEQIECGITKPIHIAADPVFIEECRKQAVMHAKVLITYNEVIGCAMVKTTFGYIHPANLLVKAVDENPLERWRDIVPKTPVKKGKGGMFLRVSAVDMLMKCVPGGVIVFEENIDISQPTIVRAVHDDGWFAVFYAKSDKQPHDPATLPAWFK